MEQRTERTRQHAEVFTPLRIVKKMIDAADEQWFGRKAGFYKLSPEGRVSFTKEKTWKKYVDARRLEITCGEAPFLVTRYDVETGEALPIEERIGLLDRKLRAVSENAADIDEWKAWALRAVQAIYGYELQGDNLLIARVNLLCSAEEHHLHRWKRKPDKAWLERLCNVISWNLWQMDGLRGCVPTEPEPAEEQLSLFPPEPRFEQESLFGEKEEKEIPCRLFDWRGDHSISYQALREKGPALMKFDFIIGNPPYNEDFNNSGDNKTFAAPIYNKFIDATYDLADRVELIHPARFLSNAGSTPKAWNNKMLNDEHLKVLFHESDARKVFSNTDIKGGIVVTYHDKNKLFGAIEVYTQFDELNMILQVLRKKRHVSMSTILASGYAYHFTQKMYEEHPEFNGLMSKGHKYDLKSNVFDTMPDAFSETKLGSHYIGILGRRNNDRITLYIDRSYINDVINLDKYKVFIPRGSGRGDFGETIAPPIIGFPGEGATETFLSIGSYETEMQAANTIKYIKTKFARALLSILKTTQLITPGIWKYVPLQDFTPASDIDWSKSIPEIDKQLYAKYGLDEAKIEFIETHVKEMT